MADSSFDIVTSLLLLGLTWPLMLGATLAIWLESGCRGPILYRQTRVGFDDRLFDFVKFAIALLLIGNSISISHLLTKLLFHAGF